MDQRRCHAAILVQRGGNLAAVRILEVSGRRGDQDRILNAFLRNQLHPVGTKDGNGQEIAKGEFRAQAF